MSYDQNSISIQDIQMNNCSNTSINSSNNNHYHQPTITQSPMLPLSNHNSHSNQNLKQKPKMIQNTTQPHQYQMTITNNHSQYKKHIIGDRFIPQKQNLFDEENMSHHLLLYHINDNNNSKNTYNNNHHIEQSSQSILNSMIIDALSYQYNTKANNANHIRKIHNKETSNDNKLLSFSSKQIISNKSQSMLHKVNTIIQNQSLINQQHSLRPINDIPTKVLDAPHLLDDYYLNLIDWGSRNIVAVSLLNYLYLWNAETMQTVPLCEEIENICSVNWMSNGNCLAVGLNNGYCDLYDIEKMSKIRKMNGHLNRISSLHWNNYLLSTGSKDSNIINHDVRSPNHMINTLNAHSKEVCALKWSLDGNLLASGGNDNLVYIWDIRKSTQQKTSNIFDMVVDEIINPIESIQRLTPLYRFNSHKAAVKALAWCPYERNVLTTGGGTKDQSIKYWNCLYGSLLKSIDTGSQVCTLLWNPHEKELISSHGYSKNQITVWNYLRMTHVIDLIGHMNRVLYTSLSPDGNSIISGAGDESLRLWEINNPQNNIKCNDEPIINSFMKKINLR